MNNYVVIDIETSGINPGKDEIIRLSALSIVNGNEAGTFFKLVKPIKPLTEEIEILTGITNVDLKEKCGINVVLPDFLKFIGNSTLVAHNIGFDMRFINAALKYMGQPIIKNETVDTLSLARKKCKIDKFSLRAVAKFLGVDYRTLTDNEIVFRVYEKLKSMDDLQFPDTCENLFYREGKAFIKRIKSCSVRSKSENSDGMSYFVYCKISECGSGRFLYVVGSGFIRSYNKVLWLENAALETVNGAIEKYESERADIRNRRLTFHSATWEEYGITVYYEYSAPNELRFNVYVEAKGVEFKIVKYVCVETIFAIIKELSGEANVIPEYGDIKNNPLYLSAVHYDDKRLMAELDLLYDVPSKESLSVLESVDGVKRLPKLSEKYDMCYVVDYDKQTVLSLNLSRYKFIHTPGFAMKGRTRSKLLINPHQKYAVDAAKIDAPSVTFDEFLTLFDLR